jgi:hypothetical protein
VPSARSNANVGHIITEPERRLQDLGALVRCKKRDERTEQRASCELLTDERWNSIHAILTPLEIGTGSWLGEYYETCTHRFYSTEFWPRCSPVPTTSLVLNHIRRRPDVTRLNEQMDVSQSSVVQNVLRAASFSFFCRVGNVVKSDYELSHVCLFVRMEQLAAPPLPPPGTKLSRKLTFK